MNQKMDQKDKIIVALDVETVRQALSIVEELNDEVGGFKIGLQFLTHLAIKGWDAGLDDKIRIAKLFEMTRGKLFVDGKFNDIPTTIGKAVEAAQSISPKFINVHASSGIKGMEAAVANRGDALVLAITVLTSLGELESALIFGNKEGYKAAAYNVLKFARMALEAEVQGIICSPQELRLLSGDEFSTLIKVIPGTRSIGVAVNDQKRVMTPGEAIKDGADYLVIGREITQPTGETSVEAAKRIAEDIAQAISEMEKEE